MSDIQTDGIIQGSWSEPSKVHIFPKHVDSGSDSQN